MTHTTDEDDQAAAKPAEIRVLYTGTEPLRITLRDGRAALFDVAEPERTLPAADARDLLTPLIGGGRFVRVGGA